MITRVFFSGCISLYLYLDYALSNDHYFCSVLVLFNLVYDYSLNIFEFFSSDQTILDSTIHTLWLNKAAEIMLCLAFILELQFSSTFLEIWYHPLNMNMLSLCHVIIRKISAPVVHGSGSGCLPGSVSKNPAQMNYYCDQHPFQLYP